MNIWLLALFAIGLLAWIPSYARQRRAIGRLLAWFGGRRRPTCAEVPHAGRLFCVRPSLTGSWRYPASIWFSYHRAPAFFLYRPTPGWLQEWLVLYLRGDRFSQRSGDGRELRGRCTDVSWLAHLTLGSAASDALLVLLNNGSSYIRYSPLYRQIVVGGLPPDDMEIDQATVTLYLEALNTLFPPQERTA